MSNNNPHPEEFRPTANWKNLHLRARLLQRVREFFDSRGFLEVETPILSADTVVDRHLDPFWIEDDTSSRRLWLQTSPEFAMKRLLASGGEAIYQITRAFRREERGVMHNPEFTIVEWYRVGDGLKEGMRLLSDLAEATLGRGQAVPISYREAFEQYASINPHKATTEELDRAVRDHGIRPPDGMNPLDLDGRLNLLLVECVEKHLGTSSPAILYDYPAGQAALARIRMDEADGPVAERFELYIDGIELANGYHELTDADELRHRNARVNRQRAADGKALLPENSRLLDAMDAGFPSSTGVALGFDRLVMVAAGANNIAEVMSFPIDRA
ncbi:MAG: EF-P lysine aminoacylase GenX [Pirellulales bacterium]|nr:EF-P lysine aminoacylase GenX [Pirellulales bacterium]